MPKDRSLYGFFESGDNFSESELDQGNCLIEEDDPEYQKRRIQKRLKKLKEQQEAKKKKEKKKSKKKHKKKEGYDPNSINKHLFKPLDRLKPKKRRDPLKRPSSSIDPSLKLSQISSNSFTSSYDNSDGGFDKHLDDDYALQQLGFKLCVGRDQGLSF